VKRQTLDLSETKEAALLRGSDRRERQSQSHYRPDFEKDAPFE